MFFLCANSSNYKNGWVGLVEYLLVELYRYRNEQFNNELVHVQNLKKFKTSKKTQQLLFIPYLCIPLSYPYKYEIVWAPLLAEQQLKLCSTQSRDRRIHLSVKKKRLKHLEPHI